MKRQRRKANEVRSRTIQRMQLQMTAPLDIGLDQHDASLALGQDDVFSLNVAERQLWARGGLKTFGKGQLTDEDGSLSQSDNQFSDSEEDGDARLDDLEGDLDGLYTAYRDRLKERDAKIKVQEARSQNAQREEWHGISAYSSDNASNATEDIEMGSPSESETSSAESDKDEPSQVKRRLNINSQERNRKRRRLVTPLEGSVQPDKATSVWFSQSIFQNIDNGSVDENSLLSSDVEGDMDNTMSNEVTTSYSVDTKMDDLHTFCHRIRFPWFLLHLMKQNFGTRKIWRTMCQEMLCLKVSSAFMNLE
jgi:AdoMet-dependent rRNA methyltransferase SPB1